MPCVITRSKSARLPREDRDEVDDVRAAVRPRRSRLAGVGDVARRELDAPARELRRALGPADERAHVAVLRAQRVHDLRADEARRRR